MELARWKSRYLSMGPELRPAFPASAIKECDISLYPNISVLLKIACTILVTSCGCKRSAITLRRLNNYMRASMGKSRLSSLALLHIHYDTTVDLDVVVDTYARLHPRRIQLENFLQPFQFSTVIIDKKNKETSELLLFQAPMTREFGNKKGALLLA